MNLPSYLERLIWKGQAEFKTRTFFGGINWAFEVPQNKTIVLLEVNYVPLLGFVGLITNQQLQDISRVYKYQQLSVLTDKNSHYFLDPNVFFHNLENNGTPAAFFNASSNLNAGFKGNSTSRNVLYYEDQNRRQSLYTIASDYVLIQQAFSNTDLLVTTPGIQFLDPITQQKFVNAYNLQIGFNNSGDLPFSSYNGDFGYNGPQNDMYISTPNLLGMDTVAGQQFYNSGVAFNNSTSLWYNVNRVMLSYVEVSGNLETLLL